MKLWQAVNSCRIGLFAAAIAALGAGGPVFGEAVTSNLRQAQANRLSYFHDYDISALGTTADDTPADVYNGGLVAPFVGSIASTDDQAVRPWYVSATPIVGFDSNPQGNSGGRSSVFGGFDLAGQYEFHHGQADPIAGYPTEALVSFDTQGAVYEGQVGQASELQQTATAEIRQSTFENSLVLTGILSDQYTVDLGRSFLNSLDVSPGVEFFALPQLSVDLSYDYSDMAYFYPVLPSQNPDANRHTVTALLHFYSLPQTRGVAVPESPDQLTDIVRSMMNRATVGFAHVWNYADGRSYQYESNRVIVGLDGLRIRPHANVTFDLQYAHEWQNYSRKSTETPLAINLPGGTFLHRKDHLDVFTLRANARLLHLAKNAGDVNGFLQWDVIGNDSNIGKRAFNEYIVSGGLTYRY